jgi:putative FmdB family regulatory protein
VPTYQYQCTECGEGLEAVQKFTDDALTECPSCAGRLRKVYSAVGVVFKGSGFYRTDSRDASKKGGGSAKSDSNGSASKDASKKSSSDSSGSSGSSGGDKSGGSAKSGSSGSSSSTASTSAA